MMLYLTHPYQWTFWLFLIFLFYTKLLWTLLYMYLCALDFPNIILRRTNGSNDYEVNILYIFYIVFQNDCTQIYSYEHNVGSSSISSNLWQVSTIFLSFIFMFLLFNYSCPHFPPITLPCPTRPPSDISILPHPGCLCPWVLYTCSLT